jgi:hypothetical protein
MLRGSRCKKTDIDNDQKSQKNVPPMRPVARKTRHEKGLDDVIGAHPRES